MERLVRSELAETLPAPRGALFLLAGIAVTLLLALGAIGVVSEYQHTRTARGQLIQSFDRRILVADLLSNLKDLDRARRLSPRPNGPELCRQALVAIDRNRAMLVPRLAGLPRQQAQYAKLSRHIDAAAAGWRRAAADARARAQSAGSSPGDDYGRAATEQALVAGGAMMAEEDRMIAARVADDNARIEAVERQVGLLMAVLALLAGLALVVEWQGRRTRHALAMAAHAAAIRLRGVFAATSDAVALVKPDGAIEAVNPSVQTLVGYSPDELIGRDIAVLTDALPSPGPLTDRLDLVDGRLREPLLGDCVAHHRDGHGVPVDVALGPMKAADGLHVVAVIRDISERKSVQRIKDEFVATVSHELRTPLTSIVGALGLLPGTAGTGLPDDARRLVQVAEENSRRLIDLINDLLDIEKMDAGELRFRNRPLDLALVLAHVARSSEALAAVRDVEIVTTNSAGAVMVLGDEGRLAQVATNLVANAIRFSPPAGTVLVTVGREHGHATVTVDDRGPGVPDTFRDRLFTRFAQSETGGSAGGTGLGLAISRQIMRAHGGTIWFAPRAGGGARFGFTMPLYDGGVETPHLLICAQDATVTCELRRLADRAGCRADRVAMVDDACAAVRSGAYHGVLVDLGERDATGGRLLAALTEGPRDRALTVPVVARNGDTVRTGSVADTTRWASCTATDERLATMIRAAIDDVARAQPLILHIDPDPAVIEQTADALTRRARLRHGPDLASAAALIARERPALLIVDRDVPDGDVADLLAALQAETDRGAPAVATILYGARPVPPELERRVDCVVAKSQRSSPNLIAAVDRLLSRSGDSAEPVEAGRAPPEGVA